MSDRAQIEELVECATEGNDLENIHHYPKKDFWINPMAGEGWIVKAKFLKGSIKQNPKNICRRTSQKASQKVSQKACV